FLVACRWVLHLEPIRRAPRAIRRVLPFRHDAFEPHLAGVGEDGRAVALDMLIGPNAGAGLGHARREHGLAEIKRTTPNVVAIQLDQVKSVEEGTVVMAGGADGRETSP